MRRILRKLILISIIVATAIAVYLSYRNKAMDRLYAEAAGYPGFYRGSRESQAAAKKLAVYRGRRSTDMLLALALQNNPLAPEAQTEAIRALQERDDPRIAPALAGLLQPHEGLDVRQTAAAALQSLPCKGECIISVLHYLERIWRGELNHEDRFVWPANSQSIVVDRNKEQQALFGSLYSVLRREKTETLGALIKVHGVGSREPSPFALDLLSRLGLHEGCPLLLQSDRQLRDFSPEFFEAPRQDLQAAIAKLACK